MPSRACPRFELSARSIEYVPTITHAQSTPNVAAYVKDRPLNSHDLVVRHTISVLVSRLLVHLTISHDFTEILLICTKILIYCVT